MMKSLLLATAAVATFAAAPALAQDAAGSIGVTYAATDVDAGEDLETWSVDGIAAAPAFATGWTLTVAADLDQTEFFGDKETSLSGSVGLSTLVGGDLRVGAFVGAADVDSDTALTGGVRVQKYLSMATISGAVAYTDVFDTDMLSASADVAFYVTPSLALNAGAVYDTIDDADLDAWTYNVGAEYDIGSTPFAVTAGFASTDIDGADETIDTWSLGLRYTFGGDKQSRDRAGASTAGVGLGSFLGLL